MHLFLFSTGWEEERVSSPSILRLIFQGRFLHGNVTLGGKTISVQRHHHYNNSDHRESHCYLYILLKSVLEIDNKTTHKVVAEASQSPPETHRQMVVLSVFISCVI